MGSRARSSTCTTASPEARRSIGGRRLINFANYNYLGLSGDPDVTRAAQDAVARWGSSVSASRVVSGERPVHRELERELARFVGVRRCASSTSAACRPTCRRSRISSAPRTWCSATRSCTTARCRARSSPARARLVVPAQRLGGARRACSAACARSIAARSSSSKGVYSADGDIPDLARFVEVKSRHHAHAHGRRGALARRARRHGSRHRASMRAWIRATSTSGWGRSASRSRAAAATSPAAAALVEYLKYTSPGFVYSVGIPPSQRGGRARGAAEARGGAGARGARCTSARRTSSRCCREAGLDTGRARGTPVIPVIVGDSLRAARLSALLFARGHQRAADGRAGGAGRSGAAAVLHRRARTRKRSFERPCRRSCARSAHDGHGGRRRRRPWRDSGPGVSGTIRLRRPSMAGRRTRRSALADRDVRRSVRQPPRGRRAGGVRAVRALRGRAVAVRAFTNAVVARRFASPGRLLLREMLGAVLGCRHGRADPTWPAWQAGAGARARAAPRLVQRGALRGSALIALSRPRTSASTSSARGRSSSGSVWPIACSIRGARATPARGRALASDAGHGRSCGIGAAWRPS